MNDTETETPQRPKMLIDIWYWRNWIALFVMGTVNNIFYVIVGAAAQSIVLEFKVQNLIGAMYVVKKIVIFSTFCNIAFGFFAQLLNGFVMERVPHLYRVIIFCIVSALGLAGLAFSTFIGFWFALISIILIGSASSFAESALLGYMKVFPSNIVSGWGAGTGLAGLGGSLLYLAFVAMRLSNLVIFLIMIPSVLGYIVMFACVIKPPAPEQQQLQDLAVVGEQNSSFKPLIEATEDESYGTVVTSDDKLALKNERSSMPVTPQDVHDPEFEIPKTRTERVKEQLARYWNVFKMIWWRALNLCLVYFLEYVVSVAFANKSQVRGFQNSPHFEVRNAFIILSFCYSIGVFFSRSSLVLFKIRFVELITFLQFLNFVVWFWTAKTKIMGVWLQFGSMILVGLLGGASYVNVYYLILNDTRMKKEDRELGVNMTAMGVTIGIASAAIATLILSNTILLHD